MSCEKKWVQHMSGQGEKWEVTEGSKELWEGVKQMDVGSFNWCPYLPKSEYRLCEPPERWVDVSSECDFGLRQSDGGPVPFQHFPYSTKCITLFLWPGLDSIAAAEGYRFRKVRVFNGDGATRSMDAFIVERKVQ